MMRPCLVNTVPESLLQDRLLRTGIRLARVSFHASVSTRMRMHVAALIHHHV